MFTNHDLADAAKTHEGLSGRVLDYCLAMKALVDRAGKPGFDNTVTEIEPFIAQDRFQRLGNFMEQMDWETYKAAILGWIPQAEWNGSFHRIAEIGKRVYLELEERTGAQGQAAAINSMTVYEFDDAGKIERLYVYLQQAPGETPSEDSGWEV